MSCEMGVRRPAWWWYLEECEKGHEWAPGRVLVGWVRCQLRPGPRRSPGAGGLGSPQRGLPGARVPVGVVLTPGTSRAHRREVQPHRVGECHSDLMTKHFPSDFYVTCATVIPVLFVAIAVQRGPYKLFLQASMAAIRATAAVSRVSRKRALPKLAWAILIRISAYAIVLCGFYGEFYALMALYSSSETSGQRVTVFVMTLILLFAAIAGPLWEYTKAGVAEEDILQAAKDQREGRSE